MMFAFLANNRDELIDRCKAKVARRVARSATPGQLDSGVPMFLDQLTRTLVAEESGRLDEGLQISGASGGDALAVSEIGTSAKAHGAALMSLGYTVDQVVHDYGDLCQAITDLAFERDAPFTVDEFRTLNRCLDNAIADAVVAFSEQRDLQVLSLHDEATRERVGFLVHELRNSLMTARLASGALEFGNMNMGGATGGVLKRSLLSMELLINRAEREIRHEATVERDVFSVASFIAEAEGAARLEANAAMCDLDVSDVSPGMVLHGNRVRLQAALANVLLNAFKFTRSHTQIRLDVREESDRVLIAVSDHCGGLPHGDTESIFKPFTQRGTDKSGMGLGLAIARHSVEADFGTLTAHDVAGHGCVFTIALPLHSATPQDAGPSDGGGS